MINTKNKFLSEAMFALIIFVLGVSFSSAVADFEVNSFSCTPSEVVINDAFSCTAQVINNGDASGSVNIATLFPDSNDWLEESSYAQSSGTSVDPGQTTEITFSGLRATKSGNNGFTEMLGYPLTDIKAVDIKKAPCADDPNLLKAHKIATIAAVSTGILAGIIIALYVIKIILL